MKMEKIAVILTEVLFGVIGALGFLFAILLFIGTAPLKWSVGIAVICLSICSGILLPNWVSFVSLILGILTLVLPSWLMGIVFLAVSGAAALLLFRVHNEYFKSKRELV